MNESTETPRDRTTPGSRGPERSPVSFLPRKAEAGFYERLRSGDEAAAEMLVRENAGRLLATARRLLVREEEARQAVRDAFLMAFRKIRSLPPSVSVPMWLDSLILDLALSRLREGCHRCEQYPDQARPSFRPDGHHAAPVRRWSVPADRVAADPVACSRIRTAVESLPAPYRAVLALADLEGQPLEQVASLLDLPLREVKLNLHRGRQALRSLLEPLFS